MEKPLTTNEEAVETENTEQENTEIEANPKSAIKRVLGVEAKKETDLLRFFKERFDKNFQSENEMERGPELETVIKRVNVQMKEFLGQYGIETLDIPVENVHVLDRAKFSPEELKEITKETTNAFCSNKYQEIWLLQEQTDKKDSYRSLVHEVIHMQGFNSYQQGTEESHEFSLVSDKGEELYLRNRRTGLEIMDKKHDTLYFSKLNEALTEELTSRFVLKYFKDWPEIAVEVAEHEEKILRVAESMKMLGELDELRMYVRDIFDVTDESFIHSKYAYHDERIKLNVLIETLYDENRDTQKSTDEVLRLFINAALKGRLLPIARLIEKTFGKGTFRTMGSETSNKVNITKGL